MSEEKEDDICKIRKFDRKKGPVAIQLNQPHCDGRTDCQTPVAIQLNQPHCYGGTYRQTIMLEFVTHQNFIKICWICYRIAALESASNVEQHSRSAVVLYICVISKFSFADRGTVSAQILVPYLWQCTTLSKSVVF